MEIFLQSFVIQNFFWFLEKERIPFVLSHDDDDETRRSWGISCQNKTHDWRVGGVQVLATLSLFYSCCSGFFSCDFFWISSLLIIHAWCTSIWTPLRKRREISPGSGNDWYLEVIIDFKAWLTFKDFQGKDIQSDTHFQTLSPAKRNDNCLINQTIKSFVRKLNLLPQTDCVE